MVFCVTKRKDKPVLTAAITLHCGALISGDRTHFLMDDASYKRLLNHRRIMQDLLIGFIAPRRPAGWAGALDFGSLRELPTENITDELRRRLGDVVWSIDRRAGDGGVHTLHVVIEHQSDVDYSMPLRFLNYTSLLYQRLYRDRTRWSKRDAMGRKWGVELPSIREYEEASAVLAEKIDRWGAEILEQGIEQGLLESIREVLELRFGAGAAEPSATHLEAIGGDVQRLKQLHRAAIQAPDLDAFRRLLGAAD